MSKQRQEALLAYIRTIAFEPRVKASQTFTEFREAVYECLKEDLPSVGAVMAKNFAKNTLLKAAPSVGNLIEGFFEELGKSFSGRNNNRKR